MKRTGRRRRLPALEELWAQAQAGDREAGRTLNILAPDFAAEHETERADAEQRGG